MQHIKRGNTFTRACKIHQITIHNEIGQKSESLLYFQFVAEKWWLSRRWFPLKQHKNNFNIELDLDTFCRCFMK